MEVKLKGVYCPKCKVESEGIEISNFSDYYGVQKVHIFCHSCNKHYYFSLIQTEED